MRLMRILSLAGGKPDSAFSKSKRQVFSLPGFLFAMREQEIIVLIVLQSIHFLMYVVFVLIILLLFISLPQSSLCEMLTKKDDLVCNPLLEVCYIAFSLTKKEKEEKKSHYQKAKLQSVIFDYACFPDSSINLIASL